MTKIAKGENAQANLKKSTFESYENNQAKMKQPWVFDGSKRRVGLKTHFSKDYLLNACVIGY